MLYKTRELKKSNKVMVRKEPKPEIVQCLNCGKNKWKTVVKDKIYQCRSCEAVRTV